MRRKSIIFGLGIFTLGLGLGFGAHQWTNSTQCEVQALLSDRTHLTVDTVESVVLIRGQAQSFAEYLEIQAIADRLGDRGVRSVVVPSLEARQSIASAIEREIGSDQITAQAMEDSVLLEGVAQSDFEADRAVQLALIKLKLSGKAKPTNLGQPQQMAGRGRWPATVIDMLRIQPRE